MGSNVIISFSIPDLHRISHDEDFGKTLADFILWRDEPRSLQDREGVQKPYNLRKTDMLHSSSEQVALVGPSGEMHGMDIRCRNAEWYPLLAERFSDFGYRTSHKGSRMVWEPSGDLAPTQQIRSDNWSAASFAEGTLSMIVLVDGLHEISRDKDFGKRLAVQAAKWWNMEKILHQLDLSKVPEAADLRNSEDTIRSGNHANPASIITVTPKGYTDIIIAGKNWGRVLTPDEPPYLQTSNSHNKIMRRLRDEDLDLVKRTLLDAGFHVRVPGRERSESPSHWNRANHITAEALKAGSQGDGPAPH